VCKAIDPVRKELVACFPKDAGLDEACFKIAYDILIIGVSYTLIFICIRKSALQL
jgi:NADH:ubiquinone reductase (non-electrogenic)